MKLPQRIDYREVSVSWQGCQREHWHADTDILGGFRHAADRGSPGPGLHSVHDGREGHARDYNEQVC